MTNLYQSLAPVYEAMYQTFIDYEEEFNFYHKILQKQGKTKVLEVGCGTGNLAPYFSAKGMQFIGLDLSEEMIKIAQEKFKKHEFMQGDMRNFSLDRPIESILITARTISYLLTNQDVNAAFSCLFKNLTDGGVLVFDFIDANRFLPIVTASEKIIHTAEYQGKSYHRESYWKLNFDHGMGFHWDSIYCEKQDEKLIEIGRDNSLLRTFMQDEIRLLLSLNGFRVKKFLDKKSYAFPTYVVVAEKI